MTEREKRIRRLADDFEQDVKRPKSFREFDTLTLARMSYCAVDTPSSVLAERVLKFLKAERTADGL